MKELQILPPRGFKPAGVVSFARFSPEPPPFKTDKKRYGKRAEGIRYENKLQEHLEELYGNNYIRSPWFTFTEVGSTRLRWCQPDGLLILPLTGRIIIVECKLQHTSNAWWQLRWLYLPMIAQVFPPNLWDYSLCEVVKWFDPATHFPEKVRMRSSVLAVEPQEFGVHIWKG